MGEILKLGVAERVSISCPTCGTRHNITPSVMSAFTALHFFLVFIRRPFMGGIIISISMFA